MYRISPKLKKQHIEMETKERRIYQALFRQELLGHRVHNVSIPESTGNEPK